MFPNSKHHESWAAVLPSIITISLTLHWRLVGMSTEAVRFCPYHCYSCSNPLNSDILSKTVYWPVAWNTLSRGWPGQTHVAPQTWTLEGLGAAVVLCTERLPSLNFSCNTVRVTPQTLQSDLFSNQNWTFKQKEKKQTNTTVTYFQTPFETLSYYSLLAISRIINDKCCIIHWWHY